MTRLPLLLAAAALTAGCGTSTVTQVLPAPSTTAPPALVEVHNPGHVTDVTGFHGPCHLRQSDLPDPACNPGSIDPIITAKILCGDYTTASYRPPSSETTKFKHNVVAPAYSLPPGVKGELDHIVSLDLGGSNDLANLYIDPGPIPNPKDTVERHLHSWVCDATGQAAEDRLHRAQAAIAANWTTAEQELGA